MKYFKNIVETIGGTPLVKLNNVVETQALVLAKVESFNPGHSTKDRMALKMIEDAEKKGVISKGATIIEGTSGNTGMGLALVCIERGYKLICTIYSDNKASLALFEKCNFKKNDSLEKCYISNDDYLDSILFEKCLKD